MNITTMGGSTISTAAFALVATIALASPARANRCDDLAVQLRDQIDGLKVGITAARTVYLSHPQAQEMSLECAGQDFSIELYAEADGRKPKPAFLELIASTAAIVFTVPKDNMLPGVTRCLGRLGILRGDRVTLRYRRLDFECTRTKTEATISISRDKDE